MKRKSSGLSILEFVATIPFTLLFLFGASDTMKVMRAQTALDNATDDALRCLAPINGACRNNLNDDSTKEYDVYKIESAQYNIDEFSYKANAHLLQTTQYEAKISADTVKNADYTFKKYKSGIEEQEYKAQVKANYYLMTKSLPKIEGNGLDDLSYVLKKNGKEEYSPVINSPSKFTLTVQKEKSSADESKYVSFSIPSLKDCDATLPCFVAEDVDKKNAGTDQFENKCPYNVCSGKVPILIAIEGEKNFKNTSDSGQVLIELQDNNGKTIRDLGGRVFTNDSSASFVPRGGEKSNFSSWLQNNYGGEKQEIQLHQKIFVNYGTKYKLRFALRSISKKGEYVNSKDEIQWTLKSLRIYIPEFIPKESIKNCQNGILKSKLEVATTSQAKLNLCNPSGLKNGEGNLPFVPELLSKTEKGSGNIIYSKNCGMTKQTITQILKDNNIDLKYQADFKEVKAVSTGCDKQTETVNCTKNYGIEDVLKNKNKCPYDSVAYDWKVEERNNILNSIGNFKTTNEVLEKREFTIANCDDSYEAHEKEIRKEYENYNNLLINATPKKTFINISNISGDECDNFDKYMKDHKYDCFKKVNKPITVDENNKAQTATLLNGKHQDQSGWKNIIRKQIIKNWGIEGLENACLNFSRKFEGRTVVDAPPGEGVEYSYASNSIQGELLGTIGEGDDLPSECNKAGVVCKKIFKGFVRNNNTNNNNGNNDRLNFVAAQQVARNAIETHLSDVVTDQGNIEVTPQQVNNVVLFNSAIDIPLNILLGRTIRLQSSSSKEIEQFN